MSNIERLDKSAEPQAAGVKLKGPNGEHLKIFFEEVVLKRKFSEARDNDLADRGIRPFDVEDAVLARRSDLVINAMSYYDQLMRARRQHKKTKETKEKLFEVVRQFLE